MNNSITTAETTLPADQLEARVWYCNDDLYTGPADSPYQLLVYSDFQLIRDLTHSPDTITLVYHPIGSDDPAMAVYLPVDLIKQAYAWFMIHGLRNLVPVTVSTTAGQEGEAL